jgi:serine/threonine protein kinase
VKSDVYSFGVVLLEVLTGLMVYDQNRLNEKNFVVFAKKSLSDEKKLQKIMDGMLEGQYSSTSAFQIAQLILKCLEYDPRNRPAMEQILKTLEKAQ